MSEVRNDITIEIGERITELARQRKISMRELAEMTNMSEIALSRIAKGHRMPDIFMFYNLAKALNSSMEFLLTGKE